MIVYFSNVSNFTHRFVEKLEVPASRIPIKSDEAGTFSISTPSVLIMPTYGANGRDFIPRQIVRWLNNENNRSHIFGVIGSGNLNFGNDYAKGSILVSNKLEVPLLYLFELAGSNDDVKIVKKGLTNLWDQLK